jgi:hypothetical protein
MPSKYAYLQCFRGPSSHLTLAMANDRPTEADYGRASQALLEPGETEVTHERFRFMTKIQELFVQHKTVPPLAEQSFLICYISSELHQRHERGEHGTNINLKGHEIRTVLVHDVPNVTSKFQVALVVEIEGQAWWPWTTGPQMDTIDDARREFARLVRAIGEEKLRELLA